MNDEEREFLQNAPPYLTREQVESMRQEYGGLSAIINDADEYGGLDRETNSWWTYTIDASTSVLTWETLRELFEQIRFDHYEVVNHSYWEIHSRPRAQDVHVIPPLQYNEFDEWITDHCAWQESQMKDTDIIIKCDEALAEYDAERTAAEAARAARMPRPARPRQSRQPRAEETPAE